MTIWAAFLFQLMMYALGLTVLFFVIRGAVISALRNRGIGTTPPRRSAPLTADERQAIEDERRPGA